MNYKEELASELEEELISPDKWDNKLLDKIPREISDDIKNETTGGPTGIGYREDVGYFVIGCGQGPFIIWLEKDNEGKNEAE